MPAPTPMRAIQAKTTLTSPSTKPMMLVVCLGPAAAGVPAGGGVAAGGVGGVADMG